MFFIAYAFKGQVHGSAGQVKIVSHSSCSKSAILFLSPVIIDQFFILFNQNLFSQVLKSMVKGTVLLSAQNKY